MTLKTVDKLEIGYSKYQLYRRIDRLEDSGLIDPERGGRNQILLKPEDIRVLRRLAELEDNYNNIQSAVLELENEILREEVSKLEDKNESLQYELVARTNIIQSLRGKWWDKLKGIWHNLAYHFK